MVKQKFFAETSEATNWILISGYHGSKLRYGNFDDRFEISMYISISMPTFSKIYQKLWNLKFRPVTYLNFY